MRAGVGNGSRFLYDNFRTNNIHRRYALYRLGDCYPRQSHGCGLGDRLGAFHWLCGGMATIGSVENEN